MAAVERRPTVTFFLCRLGVRVAVRALFQLLKRLLEIKCDEQKKKVLSQHSAARSSPAGDQ